MIQIKFVSWRPKLTKAQRDTPRTNGFLSEYTNNRSKARDCFSNFLSTSNIGVPSLKTVRYFNRVVFIPNK